MDDDYIALLIKLMDARARYINAQEYQEKFDSGDDKEHELHEASHAAETAEADVRAYLSHHSDSA